MTVCVRVHYSGHVQGVGFRYRTKAAAAGFRVTGYVKNLANGQVELVAEGDEAEVNHFLTAVDDAMAGYIAERRTEKLPPQQFTSFEIRRD